MEKPKNCKDIGFEHLWFDILDKDGRPTNPQVRECANCGVKEQFTKPQVAGEWEEIKNK